MYNFEPYNVLSIATNIRVTYDCKKMLFLLRFSLVSSQNIYKFLNQEGFSRRVKLVLFSEKNSQLSEFLLETSKIICQWGKKNNLMSNRKQDYFACFKQKLT